jgi:hypothetical protein
MNGNLLPQRDLTREEIILVARTLIRDSAAVFLTENYPRICEDWASLFKEMSLACFGSSTNMSAVAQLHVLGTIIVRKDTPVLMLRLAYAALVRVMETLKDEAAADRLAGKVTRKRGRGDASVAIDTYLNFKGIASDRKLARTQLSRLTSIGRRVSLLAGPSPLLLCAYSEIADEIVYVPPLLSPT